jgi:hypothetical protein
MLRALTMGDRGAAQFVREQGHELFLVAGGFGEAVRPLPLRLRRLTLGEVVHHPGERPGLLRLVQQGRHDGLTPEPCPVLAHLPAHAVRPALVQCRFEFVFGLAVANVFGREEPGEVLPHDLVNPVAEQALRTGVPADQLPTRLDQEEGVLLRLGRQQVKSPFPFLRRPRAAVVLGHGFTFLYIPAEVRLRAGVGP